MKHRYQVEGPYTHPVVITGIRVYPQETTQVSLFVTRDPEKGKRDYIAYQLTVNGPSTDEHGVVTGNWLEIATPLFMRAGAVLWAEGDAPLATGTSVERS